MTKEEHFNRFWNETDKFLGCRHTSWHQSLATSFCRLIFYRFQNVPASCERSLKEANDLKFFITENGIAPSVSKEVTHLIRTGDVNLTHTNCHANHRKLDLNTDTLLIGTDTLKAQLVNKSNPSLNKSNQINQSISQSINQSVNQSINQSVNQSINQSTYLSVNQSINQSINQVILKRSICLHTRALVF